MEQVDSDRSLVALVNVLAVSTYLTVCLGNTRCAGWGWEPVVGAGLGIWPWRPCRSPGRCAKRSSSARLVLETAGGTGSSFINRSICTLVKFVQCQIGTQHQNLLLATSDHTLCNRLGAAVAHFLKRQQLAGSSRRHKVSVTIARGTSSVAGSCLSPSPRPQLRSRRRPTERQRQRVRQRALA